MEVIEVHSCPPGQVEYIGGCTMTDADVGAGGASGGGSSVGYGGDPDPYGGGRGGGPTSGNVRKTIAKLRAECKKKGNPNETFFAEFRNPDDNSKNYMCTHRSRIDIYDSWDRSVYNANGEFADECHRLMRPDEGQSVPLPEGADMEWHCLSGKPPKGLIDM